ncbi:UvrD-helicase domain-containing protein [Burkholderia sp. L27(2015)]|uniref:UvrD-helicase domain-containing protein n=1 Tax=Burkholderia sp. L27(2015) TaxID=1641858 RepID=UPI00131A66F6|nr:UvrD-helicase domain-containing protein [Burkholderia sp. L27(2015)]
MPPEIDLLAVNRGSVTAPAGCGKTQLIADTLSLHGGPKPVLVLTHTNAGVSALRARLQRARVPNSAYRLSTIDGFAIRLISKFPRRSGHDPRILDLDNPAQDYPAIRNAAWQLLQAGHVNDALRATYSRLFVDEYQDCNLSQHVIVDWAAVVLPTCVLGDPMQAIFGFAGNRLVDWQANVQTQFPAIGQLQTPWRWRRAGTENLGNWLLAARGHLQAGQSIDLRGAPVEVQWVQLNPATAIQQRLGAARANAPDRHGNVLIIGDARNAQGRFQVASQTPGATAVERVDLDDLTNFGRRFDVAAGNALEQLVNFAASVMTGVGATNLLRRVQTIRQGRARNAPTPAEEAAVAFTDVPSLSAALHVLNSLEEQDGIRVYRPELLRCCVSAVRTAAGGACTLHAAAIQTRERNRHMSRPLARRSVGSTLLLKGLEADVAVILHPELMTAPNLYVALTRGAQRVVVCSVTPVLTPAR